MRLFSTLRRRSDGKLFTVRDHAHWSKIVADDGEEDSVKFYGDGYVSANKGFSYVEEEEEDEAPHKAMDEAPHLIGRKRRGRAGLAVKAVVNEHLQKILAILEAQQAALEALNDASTTTASCGCCPTEEAARNEVQRSAALLADFQKEVKS